jgi:hypothetical protein
MSHGHPAEVRRIFYVLGPFGYRRAFRSIRKALKCGESTVSISQKLRRNPFEINLQNRDLVAFVRHVATRHYRAELRRYHSYR